MRRTVAAEFKLPAIGDTMVEGEIVDWLVAPGDVVAVDQVICLVETDKSVVELSTPYGGTVVALGAGVGEVLAVGEMLITVDDGSSAPHQATPPTPTAGGALEPPAVAAAVAGSVMSPVLRKLAEELSVDLGGIRGTGPGGRISRIDVETARISATPPASPGVRAMPRVRRASRQAGIDLSTIIGTGAGGAVTSSDLAAAVQPDRTASPSAEPSTRTRMSPLRRSIAANLIRSTREIPQFTASTFIDGEPLLAARTALAG